jgi:tetratricopeptide (TPR) repeat protein
MVEPVPSELRVLAAITRLETDSSIDSQNRERQELSAAVDPAVCSSDFLPPADCLAVVRTGRLWLAWIALSHNDLDEAARALKSMPDSAWSHWIAGKSAFRYREFPAADLQYGLAVEDWMHEQAAPAPALAPRLAPQPDMARVLTDWAGTQLLTGDLKQAITNLDTATQRDPHLAFALFLRGRAKELAGENEAAQADFSLASRTAFAEAKDLASGEAHLYRGIMLYRRQDYTHAEAEFSSALNFEIPVELRPDAVAWRHLAAVAGGACVSSREFLEQSLAAVSPYFPKDEARAAASKCPLTGSGI